MGILIRLAVSAFTVWLATLVISGIRVEGDTGHKVLTLGLVSLVVNGALLLLTSKIAEALDLSFHVDHFWPSAVLGALFIGIVSWLLNSSCPTARTRSARATGGSRLRRRGSSTAGTRTTGDERRMT